MRTAALLFVLATGAAAQQAELKPLLAQIATYQYGQSREPLARFKSLVESALGTPAQLKSIEAALRELLQSEATAAGKDFALRELSFIATDASVSLLAGLLTNPDTAVMARYALARIPGPASAGALRKALNQTSGNVRIGIINSLGERRDANSVALLKPLLALNDAVGEAAGAALAGIGDQAALAALAEARTRTSVPTRRVRLSEAYLDCASRLTGPAGKSAAINAYKQLLAAEEPERLRIAALGGLAEAAPRDALPALSAALESKSPALQSAAIRFLSSIPGADVTASLVARFPKLDAPMQARMLSALADRGDIGARPLFITVARQGTGEARVAALAGLGRLGDSASVALLAGAAASSQGVEQATARAALYRLRGQAVDTAVVDTIATASGKEKVELIMAAGERGIASAATALTKAVEDRDAAVHREALRALRNVAGPAHVGALVQMLEQSSSAADRREITQTLAAALKRSESSSVGEILEAVKRSPSMPSRLALLEVLGQTSADDALPLLRSLLNDPAAEVVRGAILALSEWRTPAPQPDLLTVARTGTNPALAVLALRGYIKLIALPSERSVAESGRMLREAMQLARQAAEKRAVLSLLPAFPSKDTLQLAEAALNDEAVAKEAKVAIDRINSVLKFQ